MPCYNAERYLDLSLWSLENQWDDESLEMIFINDGSTDGTIEKLRRFCHRHPGNTQLIDKQNEGVSQARNDGLSAARGEWITFLDADDALLKGAYKGLFEHYVSNDIDVLSFRTRIMDQAQVGDKQVIMDVEAPAFTSDLIEWEGRGNDFFVKYLTNVCWIFFYKREAIDKHHVKFRGLSYLEDALFNMDVILNDDISVRRVNCPVHFWITGRPNSLSTISDRKRNTVMIGDMMTALAVMQEKKSNTQNPQVVDRITWKQGDSGHVLIPLLLRSQLGLGKLLKVVRQMKSWSVHPYRGTGVKADVLYNLLYHCPWMIYLLKPLSAVLDKRADS